MMRLCAGPSTVSSAWRGVGQWGCAAAEDLWHAGPPQDSAWLIVDVRMPRMSGLKRQRQVAATHAPLPRIVITGRNEMDPPLCGSTSMSHNAFGVRCNHIATGDESHETSDECPRD
jgi:CheY-like chemotaxis protein